MFVVLVEDNPGDARLLIEALKEEGITNYRLFRDGAEAWDYLARVDQGSFYPRPDLIFLDLNLPKLNGFELLELIKSDRGLASIPILILSTSLSIADIDRSNRLRVDGYLPKTLDIDEYKRIAKLALRYGPVLGVPPRPSLH